MKLQVKVKQQDIGYYSIHDLKNMDLGDHDEKLARVELYRNPYDSCDDEVVLVYYRLETDEEEKARVFKEERAKRSRENYERETYEKLKAKYEGKEGK
jgi:hypothetical protein